ncbi:Transcriptional regulatory protein EmbR [Actinomadura rubteroloni]|uniref:Transcriptional regulatory protein EmbR n=1 Tax=Actinomadura rubteroloni TaxID=1926885 RepID=A0A2P4UBV4_9ACTN|nr:AfsR/SARP family transcriptional regulator [Actinomadura rubteroloni]POM22533.1 Transcriptional regulatory protein EmbR [Actinomadura rubteroloni]
MRYEILGPLRVVDGDDVLTISAHKMEVLLATLLIRSGQVVSLDQLITEIWNHDPPKRATAALYVYISQLRKLLSGGGRATSPIRTRTPGYQLCPGGDELDLEQFQDLVNAGRQATRAGRHEQAVAAYREALGLWRGPVLSELRDGPIVTGFVSWLEEVRLECSEKLVESSLALGWHREVIGFLYAQVTEHPLHEAFYRQLMQALYRSERRADALNVYQLARTTLREQLGLEPGRALRETQQSILVADERLDVRTAV